MKYALLVCMCVLLGMGAAMADDSLNDKVTQFFNKFDADKDGKVTKTEFPKDELFTRLDTNRDGVITAADFKAYEAPPKKTRTDTPAANSAAKTLFARYDKNKDGKLSRQELSSNPRLFHHLDANADGIISGKEGQKVTESMLAKSGGGDDMGGSKDPEYGPKREGDQRTKGMIRHMDTNGDGKVSKEEWLKAQGDMFAKLDKNGDGQLSAEEIAAMPRPGGKKKKKEGADRPGGRDMSQMATRLFDRFDKNKDGSLTKDEVPERMPFDRMDANQDGKITKEELSEAFKKFGRGRSREGDNKRRKRPDNKEGDGDMDGGNEMDGPSARKKREGGGDQAKMVERMLGYLDKNKDGKIAKDEWTRSPEQFNMLDANKDGEITKEELGEGLKKMRGGRRGGR